MNVRKLSKTIVLASLFFSNGHLIHAQKKKNTPLSTQKRAKSTKEAPKMETPKKTVTETPQETSRSTQVLRPPTTETPLAFQTRMGIEFSGGLTGINETPADVRMTFGGSLFGHFAPMLAAKIGFFVSKETKETLPSVNLMKFDIYSILSSLYFVFPDNTLKGLSIGATAGASRIQYVYETGLTDSQMSTPEQLVVNVAQINTAFVWGPSIRFDYPLSKKVSLGTEATVLYFPEIGQLTPFSTVDVFLNLRALF